MHPDFVATSLLTCGLVHVRDSLHEHLSLLLPALYAPLDTAVVSLLLSILIGFELEDAAIIDSANIIFAHNTIFRPEQKIGCEPFEEGCTPSEEVHGHSLTLVHPNQIPIVKSTFVAAIVLCKQIFKVLRSCSGLAKVQK